MSTAGRDHTRSRWLFPATLGLAALASAWILTRPSPFALGGDAEMLLHPLLTDAFRQLRAGRLPLWTTGRWGGSPLIGDAEAGALYPPYYLAYGLTPFPHWRALDISLCLHLGLLTTGMVWCLRQIGVRPATAVATVALLLADPTFAYMARNWHEHLAAFAYWPWLFGAAAALAAEPRVGAALLAVVALAAQVYAGYPEFALYSGLPALGWIPAAPGARRARRIALAVLLGVGAVAVALPQVLPGLDMARGSIRFGPGGAENLAWLDRNFVLSPSTWLAAVRPTTMSPLLPVKLAPGVLVLAAVGALDRGFAARWLLGSAAVCGLLATGPNPLWHALHAIPPFSFFAAPLKLFYVTNFLVVALAALGLGRLAALRTGSRRLVVAALALALAASLEARLPAALFLPAGAVLLAGAPPRFLGAVATAIAVAGSGIFLVETQALRAPYAFQAGGAFMDLVRRPPDLRTVDGSRALALQQYGVLSQVGVNFGALWGIDSWNGMGDLVQWRQFEVLEGANPGAAAALARQVAADPVVVAAGSPLAAELEGAGFRSAGKASGLVRLSAPAPPLPRAQLVPHGEAAPAAVAIAAARAGRALDDQRVLIEADALPGGAEGDPAGRVEVLELLPGAERFRLAVARPTWLIVREPYYANWRATVDRRPVRIYPAGGFLLGLLVDGGTHEVRLTYREPGLLLGGLVAVVTLILLPLALRRIIRPAAPDLAAREAPAAVPAQRPAARR